MNDLISRAQIKHERDLMLGQARKAMPCTGEDEELDHGSRMYRAGIRDLARRLLALPAVSQPEAPPVVWVIPGDDTEDCNGFIDAMAYEEGEFTRPLYAHPTPAPVVPAEGLDDAHRYALHLATALRERLFPDNTNWRPLDTLLGLLTQIDNMTTAIAPPMGARVKPLVWEPCEAWKRCSKERAKAFGGEYQIVMLDPDDDPPLPSLYFEIGLGAFMFRFEQGPDPLGLPGETCPRTFPSVEAAKAAAQADYEARILAALLPAGEGE